MAIEWNPSRGATLGVEWEVQLIDSETKLLRQEAGKLLDQLPVAGDTGEHPRIRHELMQSTLSWSPAFAARCPRRKTTWP